MATETDREIYDRITRDPDGARLVDALDWEIRQGDATTRKRAETDLHDHATRAEIAAIKRWIKR
jgi:hypothetical protein